LALNQYYKRRKYLAGNLQIIFILLLSGCVNLNYIEVGKIENLIINSFKENIVEVELGVPITNPNKIGFKIKEINFRATVNNYYLGRVTCDDVIIIPPKSSEIHNINLKLRITNIIQGVSVFFSLFKEDNIEIDLEGYVKFKSLLFTRKVDIKETTVIKSFK
jgi:LEA14-like dessication related protein